MSETLNNGPLDLARQINLEAMELDRFARYESGLEDVDIYNDFVQTVLSLDERQPLMKQPVIVYGSQVTLSLELDDATGLLLTRPMAIAPEQESPPVSGIYAGLAVKPVYDSRKDKTFYRVVHTIYTGSSPCIADEHGNMQQTHFHEYVLAEGSDVVPRRPLNAHSHRDLDNDGVVSAIDRIAFQADVDIHHTIRRIGDMTTKAISRRENEANLNHQRISYLNSLGLLEGVALVTPDLVMGDKDKYEADGELTFSETSVKLVVYPDFFQIANGYDRIPGPPGVLLGGAPTLFIEGNLEDGQAVMVPFAGITKIIDRVAKVSLDANQDTPAQ